MRSWRIPFVTRFLLGSIPARAHASFTGRPLFRLLGQNDDLQEKARQCKTPEDILALAKENGYELTEEELEGINGGNSWCSIVCGIVEDPCPEDYD